MSAAATADPLKLLRDYTIQHKSVEFLDKDGNPTKELLQAETVRFGEDASFPRDTPTSYARGNNESDQYTLSALLHFLDHREQSFYEYMKTANSVGLQTVSFSDRINLLNYLTGKTSETAQAAESTAHAGSKHASEDSSTGDGRRKRPKTVAGSDDTGSGTAANDLARDIIRRERLIVTTSSALSSNKSFARVPDLIKEVFPSKQLGVNGAGSKSHSAGTRKHGASRKRRDPIIVVPAATTAMFNMYNIKDLLQDHKFVESREVMEKGGPKPREVHIEHTLADGSQMRFRVIDSVQDFTDNDWAAIVCVFTQGAAWQFKNWTWKSPEEVFKNCLGFYPKYQDERPKDSTRTWGINMLNIERSKRHTDRATVVGLWNSIE
ncbi:accessory factor associated with RNA polymerase II, partial [Linderina pennispora]